MLMFNLCFTEILDILFEEIQCFHFLNFFWKLAPELPSHFVKIFPNAATHGKLCENI